MLPNGAALAPTVTTPDGGQYALVQIEGKYTWFSIQDNPALPGRYVEVVSGAQAAELTGSYLKAAGFESQLAQARAEAAQQQREALREAFARSEIQSTNNMGPNGLLWGTPSAIGANAIQTWARSPEPGQALNILDVRNADGSASRIVQEVHRASGELLGEKVYENHSASPDGFRLVATSNYQSGVHWTLNRETGVMEQAGVAPAKAEGSSVEEGFAPDGSPLGQTATVIHEGRAHTTLWARDAATGHYTETETITRRDGAGNVTQSATAVRNYAADGTELQPSAPANPAQNEEGSVHVIPGSFRTIAPAAAPAQQEAIPQITTHEQRVTPTPGGMSFAEAHRRRDEPEQISAGSLQPVGKLDEIHRTKGGPLYRVHQAQEQALMRDLGIAQAQDRERFGNEPSPQRTLQPSVKRTQERAPESVQEQALAPSRGEHVPNRQDAAGERATTPPPSQPMAQPAAAAIAAAQAREAAAQAELVEMRQQMARMAAEHGRDGLERRDERDPISATAAADTSRPLLREFSDPTHPQHALYNTLKDGLPQRTAPQLLSHLTAACYKSGIKQPDDLAHVVGREGKLHFLSRSLFSPGTTVDVTQPAPSVQQTMQDVQQFEQQRAADRAQYQAQAAAQANQQQAPVMGGR